MLILMLLMVIFNILYFFYIQGIPENSGKPKHISVSVVSSISEVSPDDWDACNLDSTGPEKFNPFLTHGFLSSLEETGCAVKVSHSYFCAFPQPLHLPWCCCNRLTSIWEHLKIQLLNIFIKYALKRLPQLWNPDLILFMVLFIYKLIACFDIYSCSFYLFVSSKLHPFTIPYLFVLPVCLCLTFNRLQHENIFFFSGNETMVAYLVVYLKAILFLQKQIDGVFWAL